MSKQVDLTSREWRDLIFADKNKEFGAYEIRRKSDRRHNLSVLFMLIGLVIVALLVVGWSKYSDYRAEQERIAKEQAEKMSQVELNEEIEEVEEEQPEEQKFEQPEIQVPEEVLATVQVTQIAIVDADKVKNEVISQEVQQEDNTARGVVNQEGSDDADKFKAVQQAVTVAPPAPPAPPVEEKKPPKTEEIFTAVEQNAEFPGGQAALMKYLSTHINYPQSAADNDIEGRVTLRFVVERDGKVGTVEVLKGVDRALDQEAVRVVKSMPKWQPGKNNGQPVRCWYTLPVTFKLSK